MILCVQLLVSLGRENFPCQRQKEFFGFAIYSFGLGHFCCKESVDLALEGGGPLRFEGDPLCVTNLILRLSPKLAGT